LCQNTGVQTQSSLPRRAWPSALFSLAALLALAAAGCSTVGVHEQRLVSKPNMQFSRVAAFNYSSRLMPQVAPGLAVSGGAQASTCTSCR
jgi:hypothetical protein